MAAVKFGLPRPLAAAADASALLLLFSSYLQLLLLQLLPGKGVEGGTDIQREREVTLINRGGGGDRKRETERQRGKERERARQNRETDRQNRDRDKETEVKLGKRESPTGKHLATAVHLSQAHGHACHHNRPQQLQLLQSTRAGLAPAFNTIDNKSHQQSDPLSNIALHKPKHRTTGIPSAYGARDSKNTLERARKRTPDPTQSPPTRPDPTRPHQPASSRNPTSM